MHYTKAFCCCINTEIGEQIGCFLPGEMAVVQAGWLWKPKFVLLGMFTFTKLYISAPFILHRMGIL